MVSKGMLQQETAAAAAVGTTAPGRGQVRGSTIMPRHRAHTRLPKLNARARLRRRMAGRNHRSQHDLRAFGVRNRTTPGGRASLAAAAIADRARLLLGFEPDALRRRNGRQHLLIERAEPPLAG